MVLRARCLALNLLRMANHHLFPCALHAHEAYFSRFPSPLPSHTRLSPFPASPPSSRPPPGGRLESLFASSPSSGATPLAARPPLRLHSSCAGDDTVSPPPPSVLRTMPSTPLPDGAAAATGSVDAPKAAPPSVLTALAGCTAREVFGTGGGAAELLPGDAEDSTNSGVLPLEFFDEEADSDPYRLAVCARQKDVAEREAAAKSEAGGRPSVQVIEVVCT